MLQHEQTDLSITQEQRKSKEVGLLVKNSKKQKRHGYCVYSLRQESA